MAKQKKRIKVSAPGRICLFGEHQDYLALPVIAAAVNLRISISGIRSEELRFKLDLPDISDREEIIPQYPIPYSKVRDYFRSGLNVLLRQGIELNSGYECVVKGNIPINAGTSSSSALSVAWIKFLLDSVYDGRSSSPKDIARLAHEAEVIEFHEPGGKMDHYTSAIGSVLYIEFGENDYFESLPAQLGRFVLGDSGEPKDTTGILGRVKTGALKAMGILRESDKHINFQNISIEYLEEKQDLLSEVNLELLRGNIINRDITREARDILKQKVTDHIQLGELLNRHHAELRDRLKISTPKIDRMIDAALSAGALGGKINGSGGGGCMFAYAPDNSEAVAEAIIREGGKPYIISVDKGVV